MRLSESFPAERVSPTIGFQSARLKSVTDELAQAQAEKATAEATAAKAKHDLEQSQAAQKAAEQTSPVLAVPRPQESAPATQGP